MSKDEFCELANKYNNLQRMNIKLQEEVLDQFPIGGGLTYVDPFQALRLLKDLQTQMMSALMDFSYPENWTQHEDGTWTFHSPIMKEPYDYAHKILKDFFGMEFTSHE